MPAKMEKFQVSFYTEYLFTMGQLNIIYFYINRKAGLCRQSIHVDAKCQISNILSLARRFL